MEKNILLWGLTNTQKNSRISSDSESIFLWPLPNHLRSVFCLQSETDCSCWVHCLHIANHWFKEMKTQATQPAALIGCAWERGWRSATKATKKRLISGKYEDSLNILKCLFNILKFLNCKLKRLAVTSNDLALAPIRPGEIYICTLCLQRVPQPAQNSCN